MIDNVKHFDANIIVPLSKITLLVGQNGSGKTQFLRYLAEKHANAFFAERNMDRLYLKNAKQTQGVILNLYKIAKHGLVLIDNIDGGLHPKRQVELIRQAKATEGLQLIASTYSPFMLNELELHEVLVFSKNKVALLSEHPHIQSDIFLTGEFWSIVGEDWIHELPKYKNR